MAAVWPDVAVTDDSLVQCITALRRALGDASHEILQTEPKRGYRLRSIAGAWARAHATADSLPSTPQMEFVTTSDGVRLAYSVCGRGAPLVRAGRWMSHLEQEWSCLTEAPLLQELAHRFAFLRYDQRGQGLSDRGVPPGGPGTRARDLKTVVDAAGFSRFALLAIGSGAAIAVRFARLFPERLDRLIVVSGFARGIMARGEHSQPVELGEAWLRLIANHWEDENPLVRRMSTTRHYPDASREQMRSFDELQRASCSVTEAIAVGKADAVFEVSAELGHLRCPTLIVHSPANAIVPFREGRLLAAGIPGARFKSIDTPNNLPLPGEAALDELVQLIDGFSREGQVARPRSAAEDARAAPGA